MDLGLVSAYLEEAYSYSTSQVLIVHKNLNAINYL